jgi:DNA replication protein DnaC
MIDRYGGWYLTVAEFCEMIIEGQKGSLTWSSGYKRTLYEVWRDVRRANLLALDELGARMNVSDHHYECVKRLMDAREGKPTVYISNFAVAELATVYDDRIASRLAFGTVLACQGDRRFRRNQQPVESDV